MKPKVEEPTNVGVIIARFQVPFLSDAHVELITTALTKHSRVIIVLGLAPTMATQRNPLDFESRKQMILHSFQDEMQRLTVLYLKDTPDNITWSKMLDQLIGDHCAHDTVTLYGGRDSFLQYYSGNYPTQELVSSTFVSGTVLRQQASRSARPSADFRAGVIYAVTRRYDTVFPTVDIAVLKSDRSQVLMARKENEVLWRFPGGFASPQGDSFEADARREVAEELGAIEINDVAYIGSRLIDDWRYRQEREKIKTIFYAATYVYGSVTPGDDIVEARWLDVTTMSMSNVVAEHRELFNDLLRYCHKLDVLQADEKVTQERAEEFAVHLLQRPQEDRQRVLNEQKAISMEWYRAITTALDRIRAQAVVEKVEENKRDGVSYAPTSAQIARMERGVTQSGDPDYR